MSAYDSDKRTRQRLKQEFMVGVRTEKGLNVAYTIDVSRGGVKIGSPTLMLYLGGQVELVMDKRGKKFPFPGRVERDCGNHYIDCINRSVNAFFISIDDTQFSEFIVDNYYV